LVQANEAKAEGNKLFVDAKYEEALTQYELALQVAPDAPSSVEIRSICHANRGVCFLKMVWHSFVLLMGIAFASTFVYRAFNTCHPDELLISKCFCLTDTV
jgi:hypothetical protein